MANPVVRPCVSCGAPVETKRLTSTPTCSTKCYQRVRKERVEQESTLDIKIGNVTVRIMDVPKNVSHESLQAKILATLGPELMEQIAALEPQPQIREDEL